MKEITFHLDLATLRQLGAAAKERGVPASRFLADLVRERTATEWPLSVHALAGAWPDFPELAELRPGTDRARP